MLIKTYANGASTVTYQGDVVAYHGRAYKCILYNDANSPVAPGNTSYWTDVTASGFDLGYVFYKPGIGKAGFSYYGQYVNINNNPPISFTGLTNNQSICQSESGGRWIHLQFDQQPSNRSGAKCRDI